MRGYTVSVLMKWTVYFEMKEAFMKLRCLLWIGFEDCDICMATNSEDRAVRARVWRVWQRDRWEMLVGARLDLGVSISTTPGECRQVTRLFQLNSDGGGDRLRVV
jgi:hypothetical protein